MMEDILRQRGHLVIKEGYMSISKKERCCRYLKTDKGLICIWIPIGGTKHRSSLGKKDTIDLIQKYIPEDVDHIICIVDAISIQALKAARKIIKRFEVLSYADISFNKLNHYMVPEYRIIRNPDEIKQVEKKFGSRELFPKILANKDPIARLLGFVPGDLIEVKKISTSISQSIIYRLTK
jgi:DNA-directed RNA polymerase subunit H (RpoH/RPB5)